MADEEENSILTVELAALLAPGSDVNDRERMSSAYEKLAEIMAAYPSPRERFWFVAAIINSKRNWLTFGQRNTALNAAAAALGLDAHPMREDSQTDLYCMTIGFCRQALGLIHHKYHADDGYLPEDRSDREVFVSKLLCKNLQNVHPKFEELTALTTRETIRGRRRDGHVSLASDLALGVGLSGWKLNTLQDAYKEEGRKLRG